MRFPHGKHEALCMHVAGAGSMGRSGTAAHCSPGSDFCGATRGAVAGTGGDRAYVRISILSEGRAIVVVKSDLRFFMPLN